MKLIRLRSPLLLFLVGLGLWTGCSGKREALGADNEIMVIVSDIDRKDIHSILTGIFSDTVYTPQPEPNYEITFANPEGYNKLNRFTNVIVGAFGTDRTNPGTRLMQQILPDDQFQRSISGEESIIFAQDLFARNQLFLILNAQSKDHLESSLAGQKEWIKSEFDKQFDRRQSQFLFTRHRLKKLEAQLFSSYGWTLKIPWGWEMIRDSSEVQFVWLGREMPYRWFSVQWEAGMLPADSADAIKIILAYPETYYDNVRFTDYRLKVENSEFQHWSSWKVIGIWESLTEAQGGPFIHYYFYDGVTDRSYHLNMLIFHPGKDKNLFIRQLDLLAHTFTVGE